MTGPIMDVPGLAKYLGISRTKVYQMAQTKKVPASRIGRSYRFYLPVINEWLSKGGTNNAPTA